MHNLEQNFINYTHYPVNNNASFSVSSSKSCITESDVPFSKSFNTPRHFLQISEISTVRMFFRFTMNFSGRNEDSYLSQGRQTLLYFEILFSDPCGTLHSALPPLVQLVPRAAQWWGQIVIESMLSLGLPDHATRDKMRPISSVNPEKLCEDKSLVISFEHDNRVIIMVWRFRSLAS